MVLLARSLSGRRPGWPIRIGELVRGPLSRALGATALCGAILVAGADVATATTAAAVPALSTAELGAPFVPLPAVCSSSSLAGEPSTAPTYYAINLVSTKRVTGARDASGMVAATFVRSPFGVSISPEGRYRYSLDVELREAVAPAGHVFVAWVAKSDLTEVRRLGVLGAGDELATSEGSMRTSGTVTWNKYIVAISLETLGEIGDRWSGAIVARGLSRSGLLHTMAGHGPYQQEPCAVYGYN